MEDAGQRLGTAPVSGLDRLLDNLRAALAHYLATGDAASAREGGAMLDQLQGLFDRSRNNAACGDGLAHQLLLAQVLSATSAVAIAPSSLQARDISRDLERLAHLPVSVLGKDLQEVVVRLVQEWRERERRAASLEGKF